MSSARAPRFEIVRTDAGWHARFRAANGQIVFSSEVYTRRHTAEHAVLLIAGWRRATANKPAAVLVGDTVVEVRQVDER